MKDINMGKPANRYRSSLLMTMLACAGFTDAACAQNKPAANVVLPASPTAWAEAVKKDIDFAYQETLANHPGVYDRNNVQFKAHLTSARSNALALADRVTDAAAYEAVLNRFNVSLHDGHAGVHAVLPASTYTTRWPGFITVWRGDNLYVYAAEAGQPVAGTEVVACDGKSIKEVIKDNVFSYTGRSDEAGHWWVYSRLAFIDTGNPFITLPQQCLFSQDGKTYTQALTWKPTTPLFDLWRQVSYNGASLPVGLTEPRPNLLWAAMPSFQPNAIEQKAYDEMSKEITDHRERALHADAIVIDLRQNQGGSSTWSLKFAYALWGQDRVERQLFAYSPDIEVWWRASKDNIAHLLGLAEKFSKENQLDLVAWAKTRAEGMQAAMDKAEVFYVESRDKNPDRVGDAQTDLPTDPPALKTPVYVIVPGQCASACLDALDVFTRFPNTKLIGAPSSADSTYMEVRIKASASGLAWVVIPNKVYVHRPRAAGQGYQPTIMVRDIDWSTKNFLSVVEDDLVKTKKN